MTETQAKSGAVGTSATPVDEEPASGGAPATGRAAVGRAVVPADSPSPKFTRAPGMPPPPDEPPADAKTPSEPDRQAAVRSTGTAAVPVVKAKGRTPGEATTAPAPPTSAPPAAPAGPTPTGRASTGTPVRGAPPAAAPSRGPAAPAKPAGPSGTTPGASTGTAAVGAARVAEATRPARSPAASAAARGPRRARLNLKRIDPWSVMKFSFAVSVVLFIVVIVATAVLYLALDAMGVWKTINTSLTDFVSASGGTQSAFKVTAWGVIGTSMLIGAVNVVLFTALATLGAFIYNVCADLVGGVELTLAERD